MLSFYYFLNTISYIYIYIYFISSSIINIIIIIIIIMHSYSSCTIRKGVSLCSTAHRISPMNMNWLCFSDLLYQFHCIVFCLSLFAHKRHARTKASTELNVKNIKLNPQCGNSFYKFLSTNLFPIFFRFFFLIFDFIQLFCCCCCGCCLYFICFVYYINSA